MHINLTAIVVLVEKRLCQLKSLQGGLSRSWMAVVGSLLETNKYSFRRFRECAFANFCDKSVVFFTVAWNRQFLVVIILVVFVNVNHTLVCIGLCEAPLYPQKLMIFWGNSENSEIHPLLRVQGSLRCLIVDFHWKLFQNMMTFVVSSPKAFQKVRKSKL